MRSFTLLLAVTLIFNVAFPPPTRGQDTEEAGNDQLTDRLARKALEQIRAFRAEGRTEEARKLQRRMRQIPGQQRLVAATVVDSKDEFGKLLEEIVDDVQNDRPVEATAETKFWAALGDQAAVGQQWQSLTKELDSSDFKLSKSQWELIRISYGEVQAAQRASRIADVMYRAAELPIDRVLDAGRVELEAKGRLFDHALNLAEAGTQQSFQRLRRLVKKELLSKSSKLAVERWEIVRAGMENGTVSAADEVEARRSAFQMMAELKAIEIQLERKR